MKTYRNNGAIGALLDEYEKAISELQEVIKDISFVELTTVVDPHTEDLSCRSIQSILSHVVRAGYTYPIEIKKSLGEEIEYNDSQLFDTIEKYHYQLNIMFEYNERLFLDYPNIEMEEHDNDKKFLVRWGQHYDVEQLFEHAIVHVLRHRRQIERFLIKLRHPQH